MFARRRERWRRGLLQLAHTSEYTPRSTPVQIWTGPRTMSGTAHPTRNLHVTPRSRTRGDIRRIPSQSDNPRLSQLPSLFQRRPQTPPRLPLLNLTPISIPRAQARIPCPSPVGRLQPKADGPWSENRVSRKVVSMGQLPSLPTSTEMPTSMATWSWGTLIQTLLNLELRTRSDTNEAQSNPMPRR